MRVAKTFSIDEEFLRELRAISEATGMKVNDIVNDALRDYIEKYVEEADLNNEMFDDVSQEEEETGDEE